MSVITPKDRLWRLSTYRIVLRHNLFPTPESVLQASRRRRADLHMHAGPILQLVRTGDPDVLHTLFLPPPLDWLVAGIDTDAFARMLSVSRRDRGIVDEYLLRLTYRVDDDGSDERRAWAALQETLRGVEPRRAQG